MKRIQSFIMAILIFLSFGSTVAYSEEAIPPQGTSEEAAAPQETAGHSQLLENWEEANNGILRISDDKSKSALDETQYLPPALGGSGGAIREILHLYDDQAFVLELGGDTRELPLPTWLPARAGGQIYSLGVSWKHDEFDVDTPGAQELACEVEIPSGYTYSGDLPTQMVIVYDPGLTDIEAVTGYQTLNTNCFPSGNSAAAQRYLSDSYGISCTGEKALGIFLEKFSTQPSTIQLESGHSLYYPAVYETSYVDVETPGSYLPYSSPPPFFKMSKAAFQQAAVHVITPDEVDLRAWQVTYGMLYIPWVHGVLEPELWVSVDGGEWESAQFLSDGYQFQQDIYTDTFTEALYIFESEFPAGHVYELEVRYENDGISVNSFILDLTEGAEESYATGGGSKGVPAEPIYAVPPHIEPGEAWGQTVLMEGTNAPSPYQVFLLPLGASTADLQIQETITAYLNHYIPIDYPIQWSYDDIDTDTPGWQTLTGECFLPKGYFYPGENRRLNQPVIVYDPAQSDVETVVATNGFYNATLLPCGDDDEALQAWQMLYYLSLTGREGLEAVAARQYMQIITCYLDEQYYFEWPVDWTLDRVNMDELGVYYPLALPPNYFTLNDVSLQNIAFIVTEPTEVDMRGWNASLIGPTYSFSWLKGIAEPELWLSIDEGEWRNMASLCAEDIWGDSNSTDQWNPYEFYNNWGESVYRSMFLYEEAYPEGHVYEFAICYENDGVSITTFELDLRNGRHISLKDDGGGPRGGDDREETDPPGGESSKPDTPSSKQPKSDNTDDETDSGSDRPDRTVYSAPSGSEDPPALPPNPPAAVEQGVTRADTGATDGMDYAGEPAEVGNDPTAAAQPVLPDAVPEASTTPDADSAPPGETDDTPATEQPPDAATSTRSAVPVAAATVLSASGAMVLWKLFGKRLVKTR